MKIKVVDTPVSRMGRIRERLARIRFALTVPIPRSNPRFFTVYPGDEGYDDAMFESSTSGPYPGPKVNIKMHGRGAGK